MIDVVVVGAGQSGLTAATYCARAGLSTVVLEQAKEPGGLCRTSALFDGVRGSFAATWFGMLHPAVRVELGLELEEVVPPYDSLIVAEHNMARAIGGHGSSDDVLSRASGALREALADPDGDVASIAALPEIRALAPLSLRELAGVLGCDEIDSVALAVPAVSITNSETTRHGSALAAAFMGMAVAGNQPGRWGYLRGGMGDVTSALEHALRQAGGEVRCGVRVDVVDAIEDGYRVQASDGSFATTSVILAVHPTVTRSLFQSSVVEPPSRRRTQGMAAMVHLLVSDLPSLVGFDGAEAYSDRDLWMIPTTFAPDLDYLDVAYAQVASGAARVSERPLLTMAAAPACPPGRAEPPYLVSVFTQYVAPDAPDEQVIERVLAVAERCAPGLRDVVVDAAVIGPQRLEREAGLPGGHPEHLDMGDAFASGDFAAAFTARHPLGQSHPRVTQAGAATFPGGMVTGLTGRRAASIVIEAVNDARREGS